MTPLVPDLRRLLKPPPRDPLPFVPRPEPGQEFTSQFDLVGTAHFTGRSIADAVEAASSGMHSAVAIELDRARFDELNRSGYSVGILHRPAAEGEFVAATDAFGNRDGDLWLIDWSMDQIDHRLRMTLTPEELRRWLRISRELNHYELMGIQFWEAGMKKDALRYLNLTTEAMRGYSPSFHRVLIEERNLLMSARLIDIVRRFSDTEPRVLVLVGMAHVDGVRELLNSPKKISEGFQRYGLNYSSPTRIRRARVN